MAGTEHSYELGTFVEDLDRLVSLELHEHEMTKRVAMNLKRLLASDLTLADEMQRPRAERYVMRPLAVGTNSAYSVAAAVWDVGQRTPVHGHETWGVVGIYSGIEYEVRYDKPLSAGQPLKAVSEHEWHPGEVTVCCTSDDDVHSVRCGSEVPCVGIHVYGADIGTLRRRRYDPVTGEVGWFVSTWEESDHATSA